jgi:tetratricopeptide (TPR) repeat protein
MSMGLVRPAWIRALLCALVILSVSVEAQQRWYEAYDAGVKAFQRGDFDSAEANLTSALSKNAKQGRQQFFYGTIYADYFPEYYLAQILLKRGKPQQAAELLDRLAKAGIMRPRDREYAEFTRLQTEARSASAKLVAGATPVPFASIIRVRTSVIAGSPEVSPRSACSLALLRRWVDSLCCSMVRSPMQMRR